MQAKPAKSGKTVFKLDSPYTAVSWPQLSTSDHDVMLEMLVNLLSPIGHHRSLHVTPSQGKRSKKRKRHDDAGAATSDPVPAPPMPDISKSITVGINSTTRHLEQLAAARAPPALRPQGGNEHKEIGDAPALSNLAILFLLKPPNDITYAHLPLLSQAASSTLPAATATRLVPLKASSEQKLASALGLPRVGVVGVMEGAPGAAPLLDYVRAHLAAVEVPWIREAKNAQYLDVNIQAVSTGAGTPLEVRAKEKQGGKKSGREPKAVS
ncbi:uncharacterized protein K452DRAFT_267305 [Aplosporella prunicola CBS 121167]|uniref:Uncharacterized protein n=1 Tax=Aplosporella prunicola CBS 121167 TaxID=1176127 RepID=A0A6A6BL71_9PEZI|nr:uncharacterized protein K452DRAFT_267305 [Aplosporella prunicola CBS 121167]KAF2144133.1 hypothetical protein K452DRAFT_267305 [Aplosporella prunicola CBS 121167]